MTVSRYSSLKLHTPIERVMAVAAGLDQAAEGVHVFTQLRAAASG